MSDPRTLEEDDYRLARQFISAFQANPIGAGWIDILKVAFGARRDAQRERDARIAEAPYSDAVCCFGGDEPMAVGTKIAEAIRGGKPYDEE